MPDQKQILQWMTGCPASDINFQNNLLLATLGTCEKALQDTTLKKTARAAIEARRRKVEKSLPHPAAHKKAGAAATDLALASKSAPGNLTKAHEHLRLSESHAGNSGTAQLSPSLEQDHSAQSAPPANARKGPAAGAEGAAKGAAARSLPSRAVECEVLANTAENRLTNYAEQIREIGHTLRGKEIDAHYDIAAVGLYLLKVEAEHRVSPMGHVSHRQKRNAGKFDSTEGLIAWVDKNFGSAFDRKKVYRYRNLARNCGLTSDHTLEHIAELRKADFFAGKKLSDFYSAPKGLEGPDLPPAPEPRRNLVMEAQSDLFATLDQMIVLRDDMDCDDAVFETTTTRLQGTLEKWTGCKWIMADSNDAAMHGDMHGDGRTAKGAKGAKKKKGARK